MRTVTLCIALGALSCLTNSAHSNDIPEGKIYSYKEEDGVTREMEIHFPRDHDPEVGVGGRGTNFATSAITLHTEDLWQPPYRIDWQQRRMMGTGLENVSA